MDELGLFTAALGLSGPWRVTRSEFDAEAAQLDLYLDFERGARFGCPAKGRTLPVRSPWATLPSTRDRTGAPNIAVAYHHISRTPTASSC